MKLDEFIRMHGCLRNLNRYVAKNGVKNIGLEKETEELVRILYKYKKRNALIIGESGIGKTALVENLAYLINNKCVPKYLEDKVIVELSLGSSVAGTKYRGDFEEKIKSILEYIKKQKNIILFIDEVHMLSRAGGAEGAIGAGEMFKPFLARGDISVIGATTKEEYNKLFRIDKALNRRFSVIKMREPSIDKTIDILNGVKDNYERHYNVDLENDEIAIIVVNSRYKKGKFPDKALDMLEEYCYYKMIESN